MEDFKSEEELLLLLLLKRRRQRRKRTRLVWVHNINKQHLLLGEFHILVKELATYEDKFFEYFRMPQHQFQYIINLLEDDIKKELTQIRQPTSASERLAICLRWVFHLYLNLCRDTVKFNVDAGGYGRLIRKHDFWLVKKIIVIVQLRKCRSIERF